MCVKHRTPWLCNQNRHSWLCKGKMGVTHINNWLCYRNFCIIQRKVCCVRERSVLNKEIIGSVTVREIPLAPMGVLAPGSAHA